MRNILIACLLCLPLTANADVWRVDSNYGVAYQHRQIELPQDAGKCYVTLYGHPSDPQYRQVCRWFTENPDLRQLKERTHYAELPSTSLMFDKRYAESMGDLPCVRIQRPDGTCVYQCSASNLPLSAEALVNSIAMTCRRRNTQPQPSPYNYHFHYDVKPDQKPDEDKSDVQPDVFTKPESEFPIWSLVIAGVVAVLGGVAWEWRKSYAD